MHPYVVEQWTDQEADVLRRYFTNLDGPVFALVNLPEVVKGALFARYSRSHKSLRRLFLDEFVGDLDTEGDASIDATVGVKRAEALYERVFTEYGDDSVAQLGGVHLACEQASNLLTKVLEWGRLMAYLEQSTRYVAYDARLGGRYRYHRDPAVLASPLGTRYVGRPRPPLRHLRRPGAGHERPLPGAVPQGAGRLRLRVPAVDQGQGLRRPAGAAAGRGPVQRRHLRHRPGLRAPAPAHAGPRPPRGPGLRRAHGGRAAQGHPVVPHPARPSRPGRGVDRLPGRRPAGPRPRWPPRLFAGVEPEPRPAVTLVDFDPEGEDKLLAAMLYPYLDLPDDQILARVRTLSADERQAVADAYVGERRNRRHKPGRALEHLSYRFDVLSDYGAFRDLQRHRMLTIQWQALSPRHGYVMADDVVAAGAA